MHADARTLPDGSILEGDICIVGSGPAGISIALDWENTPFKIILLESGGLEYDDAVQDFYRGNITGQKYYPLRSSRLSYFGGTSGHWAGMCSPFDPIDFEKRDWVPHSGWPITLDDLKPYYIKANKVLHLGPPDYSVPYWQKSKADMNTFPVDSSIVRHKMWQNSKISGFSGGFNKAYKENILRAKNIHLYTYATTVDITANENISEIQSVTIKNLAGKTHTVKARHFILAGGAIQNARMLLAANKQASRGLGNNHDQVGRYFMEHIEVDTAEMWLLQPFPTKLFDWSDTWCELGPTETVQRKEKMLNGTCGLQPLAWARHVPKTRMEMYQNDDPRKAIDSLFSVWTEAGKMAEKEDSAVVARAFLFQTRLEQAPNPDSRITIGKETDALGVPLANLHWQLTDLDKYSMRRINQIMGEQLGKAGLARVKLKPFLWDEKDNSWPEGTNGGWHHMGTTRMGSDPKTSVVDAHCKVHGIANLFVAGAGCYTTSAAPNPTLTLVSLSLRLSDHLKAAMG